jgi:DNA-binding transcriptional LysR family regulator
MNANPFPLQEAHLFDLNALAVFVAAAECGNFSEAGRQLNLSQPAVSQNIDALEKTFGVKLFERQGRSVRLTAAGQMLRSMGRELLASAHRLEETVASLEGEVAGEMTIGCTTTSGKYLLPGLIARFRQQFPQVRVNVHVFNREGMLRRLLGGEVDFGVSSKQSDQRDFEYQDFFDDEVILIASASHRWAKFGQIYADDLLDEPMILREQHAGTRDVLADGLRQCDIMPEALNVVMELGNAEAIEMAVGEGIGVAFISRLAAARGLALGRVVEVHVEGMRLTRKIWMARNRRMPATRAQSEFWQFIQAQKGELAQWAMKQ